MVAPLIGLLVILALSVGVLLVVAVPHMRQGSRILTPEGERAVKQAKETSAAAAVTATHGVATASKVGWRRFAELFGGKPQPSRRRRPADRRRRPADRRPAQPASPARHSSVPGIPADPGVEAAVRLAHPSAARHSTGHVTHVHGQAAGHHASHRDEGPLEPLPALEPTPAPESLPAAAPAPAAAAGSPAVGSPRPSPVDSGPIPGVPSGASRPVIDLTAGQPAEGDRIA